MVADNAAQEFFLYNPNAFAGVGSVSDNVTKTIPFRDAEVCRIVEHRPEGLDVGVDIAEESDHHCPFISLPALPDELPEQ